MVFGKRGIGLKTMDVDGIFMILLGVEISWGFLRWRSGVKKFFGGGPGSLEEEGVFTSLIALSSAFWTYFASLCAGTPGGIYKVTLIWRRC